MHYVQNIVNNSPVRVLIVIALGSFFVFVALMNREIGVYDEGIVLTGALRTLAGDIPHRDYYSVYGPGQNYIVAAIFQIFGKDIMAARIYSLLVNVAIVSCAFLLTFRRISWISVALLLTLVLFLLSGWQAYLYPIYPVILLSLVSSIFLIPRSDKDMSLIGVALAGAFTGIAALFRYDGGFFILIGHFLAIVVISARLAQGEVSKNIFIKCLVYALASAFVFFPFAISYLSVASFLDFYHDIFDYSLKYYGSMRGLPFPRLTDIFQRPLDLAVYYPLIVLFIASIEVFGSRPWPGSSSVDRERFPLIVVMMTLSIALYLKGIVRVSPIHMMMSSIPASVLLAAVVDRIATRGHKRLAIVLTCIAALAPSLGAARELKLNIENTNRSLIGWLANPAPLERSCTTLENLSPVLIPAKYQAVANFVKDHSKASERIFVGLQRHDKIFINSVFLYYLTDRQPGTHWHHFDPGLQTREDVQRLMIADLEKNSVRWVIRESSFDSIVEPNGSAESSGVHLLDNYLLENFRPVARMDTVEVWLLNSWPAPVTKTKMRCIT